MKVNYWKLSIWLLPMGLWASCSEDKETVAGELSIYGESYSLEQGAVYHDNNHTVITVDDYVFEDKYLKDGVEVTDEVKGYSATVHKKQTGNFLVSLYESGFTLSDLTKDARGEGACVSLRLASPDTESLEPGKYVYSLSSDEFTFKGWSSVLYDTKQETVPTELKEGEVTVSKLGDVYTIVFDGKTEFGGVVKGSFTGELKAFDIRRNLENVDFYEGIELDALFDEVVFEDLEGVERREPDYLRATSFLASSTQAVFSANTYRGEAESVLKGIDIALAYDRETECVYFESPVRMRALLWHNLFENETLFDYTFDLPCHTTYMMASADFTDSDFEALDDATDFGFDFEEEKAMISVGSEMPRFVIVQTGNGRMGVIRVREVNGAGTEEINGVIYPKNPTVLLDIKFPRNFSEQKLR